MCCRTKQAEAVLNHSCGVWAEPANLASQLMGRRVVAASDIG